MTKISFRIDQAPVPKGRPKASFRNGRIIMRTPDKTRAFESFVSLIAMKAMKGKKMLQGALMLSISFWLPIPKSWTKAKREEAISGVRKPTSVPDLDNLIKAIKDGMNGVVYADDSAVTDYGYMKKRYSLEPCIQVNIEEIP